MKKALKLMFTFIITLTVFLGVAYAKEETTGAKEKEKVNLYLFRQTGCPHCADEMVYLDANLSKFKNKINIIVYDIYEGNNGDLVQAVTEALGISYEGAPFNVIGSKHLTGFADSMADRFDEFVNDAYEAQEKDVVSEVIAKEKFDGLEKTTLSEAMDKENIEHSKNSSSSNDSAIIIAIFGGVILLFGALIFFSKRK